MMKTKRFQKIGLPLFILISAVAAQSQDPTPAPTLVNFGLGCSGGVDSSSLIVNGDFEALIGTVGAPPPGFSSGESGLTGILTQQVINDMSDQFVELPNGASISTSPQANQGQRGLTTNLFILRFCALVSGGQLLVEVENQSFVIPDGFRGNFQSPQLRLDLFSSDVAQDIDITFTYAGNGTSFIDNVELIPDLRPSTDSTPVQTPVPSPSPTPTPTDDGPSPTPTPTLVPGVPTFTPTPALTANSVQVIADPPMLVLSPDDFVIGSNPKKQVLLDIKVIGSNGEPLDITSIDEDATIRFTVDTGGAQQNAGTLLERLDSGQEQFLQSQRRQLQDVETVIFIPGKAFDGTVRIIVDIEFDGEVNGSRETQEIRGVVPIVMRTDKTASLTGSVGSFNLSDTLRAGRKPGDRGFRPDQKTNLFFHELFR